jgi:hypothetical protein
VLKKSWRATEDEKHLFLELDKFTHEIGRNGRLNIACQAATVLSVGEHFACLPPLLPCLISLPPGVWTRNSFAVATQAVAGASSSFSAPFIAQGRSSSSSFLLPADGRAPATVVQFITTIAAYSNSSCSEHRLTFAHPPNPLASSLTAQRSQARRFHRGDLP